MKLFKQKTRVCVELGGSSIKILATKTEKEKSRILFMEQINLLETYNLESIFEISEEHYIEQLIQLKEKHNLSHVSMCLVIPANTTILHNFDIDSNLTAWEINEAIQNEVEQVSMGAHGDLRIVCHNQSFDEDGKRLSILACGISNIHIELYLSIFERAGLKLAMITVDALELFNAYSQFENKGNSEPATLIFSGDQHIICLIIRKNDYPFIRTINLDKTELDNLIQKNETYNLEENEYFDFEPPDYNIPFIFTVNHSEILKEHASYPTIDKIVTEIKKCQNHIRTCEGVQSLGEIKFTGQLAKHSGFITILEDNFQEKIKLWNPFDSFMQEPDANNTGFQFAATLGASIRVD